MIEGLWCQMVRSWPRAVGYAMGGENDGELVYITYDWEHPPIKEFDPPLVLESGQGFRLETTYDNPSSNGLRFGLRSTDEMMILFGAYY